jgi:tRNA (cytidine56-2'-O)-methyltransferase
MTTHVCLTARALGASRVYVDAPDPELEERLTKVAEQFGGDMELVTGADPRRVVKETDLMVVHLTMYGENVVEWNDDRWDGLRSGPGTMVVVGATKVPREFFELADVNAAVGNQPHSEVAALAVFLDRLTEGQALRKDMKGRLKVVPQERGKVVWERDGGDDP